MPWTVTRQVQYPDGTPMVEVSSGGMDYSNPDALVGKYPGEFETYDDPVEAADKAIEICDYWRADGKPEAQVGHGATGGMIMPFDPCTFEELKEWAERVYEKLPKCDRCGELLPAEFFTHPDMPDEKFCREYCAEERAAEWDRESYKDLGTPVCDSCLMVAYDAGIEGMYSQATTMIELGSELPDHTCDVVWEPELVCNCGCRKEKKPCQPKRRRGRMNASLTLA